MAYKILSSQDFQKKLDNYLKKYPLPLSVEENLINNFSSSNLSDLYKLFLDLEGLELNANLFNQLKDFITQNFDMDIGSIFSTIVINGSSYCISEGNIHSLENIIKNKFLSCISNPESKKNIDEKELYNLTVIVNKIFPTEFLTLIKTPNSNIDTDKEFICQNILNTIEHYHKHNSKEAEEENRDILGALYITSKKLYPDLDIYIPGRVKSMKSAMANINKESAKSLSELIPSDFSVGLTDDDIKKQFNIEKANTDFSGLTIILSNTDDTLHFDKNDPKSSEVFRLKKIRQDNISFTHKLENFLAENDNTFFSNIDLLKIKIDLLMRLRLTTYEQCTKEYQNTSFTELLKESIQEYQKELENPSEEQSFDDEATYFFELDKIYELLDELKKRVHDKYQAKILEIIIPEILNDELITDTLKIKSRFVKKVQKENGFCSDYYELITADGRKIELQALPKFRFKDSKDGASDHSNLPNKKIDILDFFEPTNPDYDSKDFNKLLSLLDNTPIAVRNALYTTPDQQLSPTDKRLKIKLKTAERNVKLKDHFEDEHVFPDGRVQKTAYSLDSYLLNFAKYVSPKLMSASSHHTRFHKGVAGYSKKSLISGFTEVLLKHDSTSCLAQILIDKLETLIPNDKNEISRNGIIRRSNKRYSSVPVTDKEDLEH